MDTKLDAKIKIIYVDGSSEIRYHMEAVDIEEWEEMDCVAYVEVLN